MNILEIPICDQVAPSLGSVVWLLNGRDGNQCRGGVLISAAHRQREERKRPGLNHPILGNVSTNKGPLSSPSDKSFHRA